MPHELKLPARLFIGALLLCAFIGSVRAQEPDAPPPVAMDTLAPSPAERDRLDDARLLAELREEALQQGARVIRLRPPAR